MEVHQVSLSVCLSLPHSLSLKDIQEPLINCIMTRVTNCPDLYIFYLYTFLTISCKVQ